MTIIITGLPGSYRTIPESWRRILMMNFDATADCVDHLEAWARDNADHRYDNWPEAVAAIYSSFQMSPAFEAFEDPAVAVPRLVREAAGVVRALPDLTGASASNLGIRSNQFDQSCAAVVREGSRIVVRERFLLTAADVESHRQNLPRLAVGEAEIVEFFVHHPYLAAQRPSILAPGSVDSSLLTQDIALVRTRDEQRSSAIGHLDANVGGRTVAGDFIANSGRDQVEHRYTLPANERAPQDPGTRIERLDPQPINDYVAFRGTIRGGNAFTRQYDGEKRILDAVTNVLTRACASRNVGLHQVTGTLRFATTLRMCPSCYLVACQFLVNFPALTIAVSRIP